MAREFNVLALIKGDERYIFVYDDESRQPRPIRPGEFSMPRVEPGENWNYRLVLKKNGKVVSDTGYFKAVLSPIILPR